VLLGLQTVGQVSRALCVSPRQVDRYRAGEEIPRRVIRMLELMEQVERLRREVKR
jgi:hypothetical protein